MRLPLTSQAESAVLKLPQGCDKTWRGVIPDDIFPFKLQGWHEIFSHSKFSAFGFYTLQTSGSQNPYGESQSKKAGKDKSQDAQYRKAVYQRTSVGHDDKGRANNQGGDNKAE